MNETSRKWIIYLTLPIAIIWAVANLNDSDDDLTVTPPATIKAIVPTQVAVLAPEDSDIRLIDIEEKQKEAWGNDPFRTYLYSRKSSKPISNEIVWVLKGIIYNHDNPQAFLNNKRVSVGDTVNKAKVIAINRKTVVLNYKGKEIRLQVNKG